MQQWKQKSWDTVASSISPVCFTAMPTRSGKADGMWNNCRKTPQPDASGKKGGRKKASCKHPELVETLREIVEVHTAGSPVDPGQLWTNRSPSELSDELSTAGFSVCANTVACLLRGELGLSRRSAVKTVSLGESVDRNAQFERLAKLKKQYFRKGWAVIFVVSHVIPSEGIPCRSLSKLAAVYAPWNVTVVESLCSSFNLRSNSRMTCQTGCL